MDRMQAVKALAAAARDAREPGRVRALLEAARADTERNVARQAEVAMALLDGIDPYPSGFVAAHHASLRRERFEEARLALSSDERMERMHAVKDLAAMASSGDAFDSSEIEALLEAAQTDPDHHVASQAEVALARLAGIDVIPPAVRRAHRLSMEREQVDECSTLLGSDDTMERIGAVKALAALADDALEPERVLSLLQAAHTDLDSSVAAQAGVALDAWRARREDAR